uniref:Uncharacterized protein n=1 Tax=Romanomermis culicivorax TaxID=13658 RepID=A0A915IKY8_ROMCU
MSKASLHARVTYFHDVRQLKKNWKTLNTLSHMRRNQYLLIRKNIKFWGYDLWHGNSPDFDPTENLDEILKNKNLINNLLNVRYGSTPDRLGQLSVTRFQTFLGISIFRCTLWICCSFFIDRHRLIIEIIVA